MSQAHVTVVIGVFDDPRMSQMAVEQLKKAGFTEEQIGVATQNRQRKEAQDHTPERVASTHVEEGAVAGAIAGAGAGTLWALGMAAGVLPGIGPVVAGGVLGSMAISAVTGAVAGGVVGSLMSLGLTEQEARHYERELQAGRIILAVRSPDRFDEATDILRQNGAINLGSSSERNDLAVEDKREEEQKIARSSMATGHVEVDSASAVSTPEAACIPKKPR